MKSFFKKMAIMLICMSVFLSYMPWNVVFAADEIAETPQNVITEETQGSGEVTNPEEANTQLENLKSNTGITEELQGEPSSQANEDSTIENVVKNVKDKVQNVLKSGQAPAKTPKNPEDYFIFNESTNTITGYSSSPDAPKDIKIPAKINGVNVEHIGNNAFSGQQLTGLSFEVPSNLKSIGNSAFENNKSLSGELVIPDGLERVGNSAFKDCTSLLSVTIPEGIKNIDDYAFSNCYSIESTIVPASANLGKYVYSGCRKIVNVKISNGVKRISEGTFNSCYSLKNIIIPDSVEVIGAFAFANSTLESIDIGNSVKLIDRYAFATSDLKSITIPYSVTTIEKGVFEGCQSLVEIRIPDKDSGSITGEPWGAPKATVYWKNIKLINDFYINTETGSIVKYTGNETNLIIPSSFNIEGQDYQISRINANALQGNSFVKKITIQNGITSVGKGAFAKCSALETVIIPDSMSEIGENAFLKDNNLKKIDISGKDRGSIVGAPWGAENAAVYWRDTKVSGDFLVDTTNSVITKYLGDETVVNIPEKFVIDGKVCDPKSIGPYAFANKSQITEVKFPYCYSLTNIGEYAFSGCSSLHNLYVATNLTSAGKYAFKNCKKFIGINLGEFTIIEEGLYYGCESLTLAELDLKNATAIKKYAFQRCKNIRYVILYESLTEIGDYAFGECDKLRTIYLRKHKTDSIKGAPWGAWYAVIYWSEETRLSYLFPKTYQEVWDFLSYDTERKEIFASHRSPDTEIQPEYQTGYQIDATIPSTIVDKYGDVGFRGQVFEVKSIGKNVFYDRKYLKTVTIEDGIREIGDRSFAKCSSLNSISIPASVNNIDNAAFEGCSSLTNVNLPEGMKKIKQATFKDCTNLEKINIPDSIEHIDFIAFKGCSKLKTLNIPEGVNDISVEAFTNSGIETIYVDQNRSDSPIANKQPWGATGAKVYFRGEFLNIDTTAEKVKGEYARNIKVEAYIDRQKLVSKIIMPDGTVVNVGQPIGTADYKVTQNGTYVFKGYDDSGNETEKSVNISDIGKINLSAKNANINPEKVASLTKSELLKLIEASASDDAGDLTCDISNDDLNKVKALKKNEGVSVTVTAKNKFGTKEKIVNIVAVPDIVPGSQEKPAGYVTVTFAKGEHGKLSGEMSQHVNPTKVTDLKTLAPKVTADTGFKHTGWNGELKKKFTEDTTITATYEAVPDTVPGSKEKPAGYVTVTFAKGEHGSLSGEISQHVNPTKVTDLKTLAPKVTADTGFKHTGWNSELKKKFTEDTTITATYDAVTENFAITIDPDGGSWNGSTDPIVYNIEKGEYITLPDAPTKDGYTFKYWKGSKYMPGDKYKVEGEHKFTAVWEKKATSKTDDSSTGKSGTSGTAGANGVNANKTSTSNHAPFTADSQNIMLYLMMSIFSFVLIFRLRDQEN